MPVGGKWTGCGHRLKQTMVGKDASISLLTRYVEFLHNNPRDLCWKCWHKDRGLDNPLEEQDE